MTETTRVSLLQQLGSNRDTRAWSKFVQLYTPLICRWVTDLRVPETERNDVAQEVFIVLMAKISSFKYDANRSFRGWLRTITINKCRDYFRKKNRLTEPKCVAQLELANANDIDLLTQQEYRDHLAESALLLMKKHFSNTTWKACWEHVANGRSAPDVAQELGISANAVYLARGRVLQRLRQELEGLWE